jgi:hypothetical protein
MLKRIPGPVWFVISFTVLVCCALAVLAGNRNKTAPVTNQPATVAPVDEAAAAPAATDTPLPEPTPAEAPTSTPAPELSFAEVIQAPKEKGWDAAEYSTYIDTLKGRQINGWAGTILEIDEYGGEPYLSLDVKPGEPKIDVYAYIRKGDVPRVGLGQDVTFSGSIDSSWSEGNDLYSLQVKEVKLIDLGEIPPTPTPTPNLGSESAAQVMCEQFVTESLKSPSTADFGGLFDDRDSAAFIEAEQAQQLGVDTSKLRNTGVWVVAGSVDAQNSFGAMIRSEYACVLDYEKGSDTWYLLDISIK